MKFKMIFATVMAAFALVMSSHCQNVTNTTSGGTTVITNTGSFSDGFKIMAQAITSGTNWTVLGGYGRSTKSMLTSRGNNIAFMDVAYQFDGPVGLVAGYDYLWAKGQSQANAVKGGVTLSATIHPLAFVGSTFLTNVVGTPFVGDLLATPKNGNAIGNIVTTGINFDLVAIKNFELSLGAQYENRAGQGVWDGNYVLGHAALTRKF